MVSVSNTNERKGSSLLMRTSSLFNLAQWLQGIDVAVDWSGDGGAGISGRSMLQDERSTPVTSTTTSSPEQRGKLRVVMASSVD
jgi:hypothetical protein